MFIYASNPNGFKSLLFASEYGKIWPLVKEMEKIVSCVVSFLSHPTQLMGQNMYLICTIVYIPETLQETSFPS